MVPSWGTPSTRARCDGESIGRPGRSSQRLPGPWRACRARRLIPLTPSGTCPIIEASGVRRSAARRARRPAASRTSAAYPSVDSIPTIARRVQVLCGAGEIVSGTSWFITTCWPDQRTRREPFRRPSPPTDGHHFLDHAVRHPDHALYRRRPRTTAGVRASAAGRSQGRMPLSRGEPQGLCLPPGAGGEEVSTRQWARFVI